MRNLTFTSLFALAFVLATAPATEAGERHGHRHHDHHHGSGVNYPAVQDHRKVSVRLNQRVRNEVIPLRRLLDLDQSYSGYKLERVVVRLKRCRNAGRLALIADGEVIDTRRALHDPHIVLRPNAREVLGVTLKRLQLVVDGAAFIKSIEVQLAVPRPVHRRAAGRASRRRVTQEEISHLIGAEVVRVLAERTRHGLRSTRNGRAKQ